MATLPVLLACNGPSSLRVRALRNASLHAPPRSRPLLAHSGMLAVAILASMSVACDSGDRLAEAPTTAADAAAGSDAASPDGRVPPSGEGPSAGGASSSVDAGRSPPARDAGGLVDALRGVCWNPVPVGARHPEGLDYAGFAARDIPLMAQLGINVVRTYEPLLDRAVLDALWAAGIRVIDSVYPYGGAEPSVVIERVRAVADHPAILYYSVGNEWNYNGLYVGLSQDEALARVAEAARLIHAEDPRHLVATIYGELPSQETIDRLNDIDVWGINAYRGISFGDLFARWRERTSRPMFVAEYGADAFNANLPGYDPDSQALAAAALTREILDQVANDGAGARVLGGTIFEWADEWWKDEAGSLDMQEVGGIAPGGGPYPDQVFNEEWWGLVDIQRSPRPAFDALRAVFVDAGSR